MLTPATARTGSASSCYSLGSYRPAAGDAPCSFCPKPQQLPTEQTATLVSHSDPWYEVSSLVVVGAGGRSLHRRPHSVVVVLTDKDAGQLPQRSHVERLEQLALVGLEQRRNPNANTANLFIFQS